MEELLLLKYSEKRPNFDVSIRAKQKKYFIDKRYLAQL